MSRQSILKDLFHAVLVLLLLSGCTGQLRNKQLENVAKDWSYVIRASQVIPVYPLTEDLQPGDILLVSTPIDEQQKNYEKKGFLPLDQLLKRLNPTEYSSFYSGRYDTDSAKIPPAKWQEMVSFNNHTTHQWIKAPHASFPSYNFAVDSGGGVNLAIPIQGVPVALGLMKTGKASGSVTISNAYTFGLDNVTLLNLVNAWGKDNRQLLRTYKPAYKENGERQLHFLRVVSRVYTVGDLNVTMKNDEAESAEVGAGANKAVSLPELQDQQAAKNYQSALNVFNDALKDQLPGGKVKISAATSRSVTLHDHFDRPLVIGYVGFDMPILEGGRLGSPISTLTQLTKGTAIQHSDTVSPYRTAALENVNNMLQGLQGKDAEKIRLQVDRLGQLVPNKYEFPIYRLSGERKPEVIPGKAAGDNAPEKTFSGYLSYRGQVQSTLRTLKYALDRGEFNNVRQGEIERDLALKALERLEVAAATSTDLAEAIDFAFFGE